MDKGDSMFEKIDVVLTDSPYDVCNKTAKATANMTYSAGGISGISSNFASKLWL